MGAIHREDRCVRARPFVRGGEGGFHGSAAAVVFTLKRKKNIYMAVEQPGDLADEMYLVISSQKEETFY